MTRTEATLAALFAVALAGASGVAGAAWQRAHAPPAGVIALPAAPAAVTLSDADMNRIAAKVVTAQAAIEADRTRYRGPALGEAEVRRIAAQEAYRAQVNR